MKKPLIIESITYDLQYFFTNQGIVKISVDENENIIEYNSDNFKIGLNILKENLQTKFDIGLISENDYIYSARKFLYESIDVGNIKNQISIINEWETKYGKNLLLVNENIDKTDLRKVFNNSWSGVISLFENKIINTLMLEQLQSLLKWGWDGIKSTISKAFSCPKGGGYIDCFMEGLRTIATSFLGVAVLTGVSFVPVIGQIPNVIIFGALLIYDIYKMVNGKDWSLSDIIVDIVSLLAPALAKGIGAYTKGLTSFYGLGKIAGSGKMGKFVQVLSKGIGSLASIIGQTVTYFSTKLGIKWLGDMAKSAYRGLKQITNDITAGQVAANKETSKSVEKSLQVVPQNWKKYPCVALSKNVKQRKTSDGTIVYEGGGFIWFDNGKKINPKTEEISGFSCTPDGKVKSEESSKSVSDKVTSDKLEQPKLSPSQIKRVQSCLGLSMDGVFTKTLQDKMKSDGYGENLNQSIYDRIMTDCRAGYEDGALPSASFSKDI